MIDTDKLTTICAAARQYAYEHDEDPTDMCVLLNIDAWRAIRREQRATNLFFDEGFGTNTQVFFFNGMYVSWSPLMASPLGYVIGKISM